MITKAQRDIAAAVFLFAIAFGVWMLAADLPRGTLRRMGPGFMPLVMAVLLSILGVIILIQGLVALRTGGADEVIESNRLSWRSLRNLGLVVGSIVLFAHGVNILGLAITAFAVVLIVGQSSSEMTWKQCFAAAAGFAAFSVLLFKIALNLSMPIFPW